MTTRWMARKPSADKATLALCLLAIACNREKAAASEADSARHAGREARAEVAPSASSASSANTSCPRYRAPAAQGILRETNLSEISGLVRSALQGHFWVHNDSGDEARVYALSPGAEWLATYRLAGVPKPKDAEDLAIATHEGRTRLYLGDIGDNKKLRSHVEVHRFEEPLLRATPKGASPHRELSTGDVTTVRLTYPDGGEDAEALVIDPETEAIIIVSKAFFSPPKVYVRTEFSDGPLTLAGEMSPEATGATLQLVTAADVTRAGDFVGVRTYDGAYLFRRVKGQSLAVALLGPACPVTMGPEKQGEALALLDRPGRFPAIATMSEGKVTTLWLTSPE